MQPQHTGIGLPWMRAEVMGAVDALADPAYQQRVWIEKVMPHASYHDDLSTNVHTLHDSPDVLSDPRSAVGTLLFDDEVPVVEALARVVDPLLRELGNAPDRAYLDHPGWAAVVTAAREAAAVLHAHGGGFVERSR